MRKNYFDKIYIVDSSLRSILSTYIGISNRLENKLEFTTIIDGYVSELNSDYKENNNARHWKRWLKWK
ncbi:MAG: hypothetical protein HRS57_02420 [Mycoplasmataceae bacterium]|nr:hypothetical protein [Mycoplasmataceae bacterium]